ncbi:hypothetical protein [Nannocystis pusilla]|uniref:hypothetical protein n=1 Tax=Nannocystis pusilla TaxID=889268 RepID=UPI003B79E02A
MTYFEGTRPLLISSLLAACGPGGPADTEGASSEGPPTTTTEGPTTEGPTTEGPTTTSTTTTSTTTSEETTIDEPPASAACERLAGPADGAVDWYLRCGGLQHEYLGGVATDAAGNIYLGAETRVLEGSQALQIGEFEVTPGELSDILLIKLSSEGVPEWVRQFGGPGTRASGASSLAATAS